MKRFDLAEQIKPLVKLVVVYDTVREEYLTIEDVVELLNETEEQERRLFHHFLKWFEEERGMTTDTFNQMWHGVKIGLGDDDG